MIGSVITRRAMVGGLAGCAIAGPSAAASDPAPLAPLIGPGYRPVDPDEKGLWQLCDRLEEETRASSRLVAAPALKEYVDGVIARLLRDRARDVRVYLVHDADFNATMAPNGMCVVYSGLLARCRSEAQLAAVLGHESGHYLRRHQVSSWRDRKAKTGVMAFVRQAANIGAGVSAGHGQDYHSWHDMANSINAGLALSLFSFSRAHESEADAYGVKLLAEASYPPSAASEIWAQQIEERRRSAAMRGKRYRDRARSALSTHPPDAERMLRVATLARAAPVKGLSPPDDGAAAYRRAMVPFRAMLLAEQIERNDPGASLAILEGQAASGWDGTLRYMEGEVYRLRDDPGDQARAASSYAVAVALPDAPPEAWRAHGYACLKMGDREEGRRALARYLELSPDAADAAMVRVAL